MSRKGEPALPEPALRALPSVHYLLQTDDAARLVARYSRETVRAAVREHLADLRIKMRRADSPPLPFEEARFFAEIENRLQDRDASRLQRVINATGIVLHTNLGRAPLAAVAADAARNAALGYLNLEMDLVSGQRGARGGQTEELICRLTGAEAAIVVNNNAAGVLLALGTLIGETASGEAGEVIVSRGELVEIGGSFRIPDVIHQSGARLVEAGATNRTRLSDYRKAITAQTRALLKVHASNYRIVGFTEDVGILELVALGRETGIPVMEDLGSGALIDLSRLGLPKEPTAGDAITAGVDVVAFSGDKLLGGPQCGILAGKETTIRAMGRHPLFRALRVDKMTLAALEATLRLYEDMEQLRESLPILCMLTATPETLTRRARRLRAALTAAAPGFEIQIADSIGYSGGGTLPEIGLPSKVVRIRPAPGKTSTANSVEEIAETLRRRGEPPVIGVLADGWFTLDVRTMTDDDLRAVARSFRTLFSPNTRTGNTA